MMEKVCFANGSLRLTIAVTGYEFPKKTDKNDADWLNVEINLVSDDQQFCKTFPALQANDLDEIWQWFESLARGRLPQWINLSFTEPNLEFDVFRATDKFVRISINLGHENRPPFNLQGGVNDCEHVKCIFELTYAELANIAAIFQQISEQFPSKKLTVSQSGKSQHFTKVVSTRFP